MFNFNLLPTPADNKYRGNKAAFWFFIAFVCLMTWRSIIHMLFEEYGAHGIANIIVLTGDPDPMPLLYMFFSLWGFAQLIFCGLCWIVIFRYRSLISLMYCILVNRMERQTVLIPFDRKKSFSFRNLYNWKYSRCGGCSVRNYFDVDLFGAISETKNRGIR